MVLQKNVFSDSIWPGYSSSSSALIVAQKVLQAIVQSLAGQSGFSFHNDWATRRQAPRSLSRQSLKGSPVGLAWSTRCLCKTSGKLVTVLRNGKINPYIRLGCKVSLLQHIQKFKPFFRVWGSVICDMWYQVTCWFGAQILGCPWLSDALSPE